MSKFKKNDIICYEGGRKTYKVLGFINYSFK